MTEDRDAMASLEYEFARSLLALAKNVTREMEDAATRHIVDFIGVTLAGMTSDPVTSAARVMSGGQGVAGGYLLGSTESVSVSDAIFGNTMAGHIHDFDDDETLLSIAHVTVPVAGAAWTLGVQRGASGREIISAYVAGVEAMMRMGQIINPNHYLRGWHSSATLGGFGAATAVAVLCGFDEAQLVSALRLAASSAAGMRKSFGSDAKAIQVARSAANGYLGALLAGARSTGTDGMLFGPNGFVDLYGGDCDRISNAIEATGNPAGLISPGITIKAFPCCTATHTTIEAVLTLMREQQLAWTSIRCLAVTMGADLPSVLPYDRPRGGLEAKFSMRYCAAGAAFYGRMGIEEFSDAAIRASGLQQMLDRTVVTVDLDTPRPASGLAHDASVSIETVSGKVYKLGLLDPLGSKRRPMPENVFRDKFLSCCSSFLGNEKAEAAYKIISNLKDVDQVGYVDLTPPISN